MSGCILSQRYKDWLSIQGEEHKEQDDDLISRQAVTDTTICDGISCNECSFNTCEDGQLGCLLKERVDKLPPVNPQEPKTGHWVKTPKAVMGEGYMWYCDKCEHQVYQDSSRPYPSEKYCPNCGAKMVEPKESEVSDADSD